jgi:hypothetical protein
MRFVRAKDSTASEAVAAFREKCRPDFRTLRS